MTDKQAAQPAEADGWVMVPRDLTYLPAMREAAWKHINNRLFHGQETALQALWSAMLAATPKAPAIDAGEVERNLEAQRQTIEACAQAVEKLSREVPYDYNQAPCSLTKVKAVRAIRALRPNIALATPPAPNDDLRAENERLRNIVQVVADADSEDAVGSLDVDIPSNGYPRQWLRDAARAALLRSSECGQAKASEV